MLRLCGFLTVVAVTVGVLVAGCTQAAPSPTAAPAAPTTAPTALPKPAEATKPTVAAAPTTAPAQKVNFPQSGRPINFIVPYAPGGNSDTVARLVSPFLEKELGVAVQVVNKPGAATQIGMTELAAAKPDGYTIGVIDIPTGIITYMLPDRKATYTRKSFQPLWLLNPTYANWAVEVNSPLKGVADAIQAAKAKPGVVSNGDAGLLTSYHLANLAMQKSADISMNLVHFEGSGPAVTATIGGHTDISTVGFVASMGAYKAGQIRYLGTMGPKRDPFFPDVKTFEEQGYKVPGNGPSYFLAGAPAGLPQDVADVLTGAFQKAMTNPDFKKKADDMSISLLPMGPTEINTLWGDLDTWSKEMLTLAGEKAGS